MTEPNETPLKPKLLPCPFCGREPVVADIGHGDVFYRCPMDCTTGMSAEAWNRRADPAPAQSEMTPSRSREDNSSQNVATPSNGGSVVSDSGASPDRRPDPAPAPLTCQRCGWEERGDERETYCRPPDVPHLYTAPAPAEERTWERRYVDVGEFGAAVRFEIEFADGHIVRFEGNDAQEHLNALDSACSIAGVHGATFPAVIPLVGRLSTAEGETKEK